MSVPGTHEAHSAQFKVNVTWYDGRPNHLGTSQCTVVNGERIVVQGGNGRLLQFPLARVTSVGPAPNSGEKDVNVEIGGFGAIRFWFPNQMQAWWLQAVMREAMAGALPNLVPELPTGAVDRSALWGNLGIAFGICFFPLGVLFGILSFIEARKFMRPPVRAIIAFLVSATAGICFIVWMINNPTSNQSY